MASLELTAFPDELLVRILENLDGFDLVTCSLTCRLLRNIISDACVLKYKIELTIAGAEDCGSLSPLSMADRLAELKTFQENCATLRFRKREKKWMTTSNVWELFGGFLARGVRTNGTRGLAFFELPSVTRATPGRAWEHRDMGMAIRDFTIDPTQDLVVLISHPVNEVYRIHIRAMSTGQAHPRATDSALTSSVERVQACDFIIQIMDEYLGVLFHTLDRRAKDELYIWNWQTGKIVAEVRPSLDDKYRIDSFSFISPRHFVISRFQSNLGHAATPLLEVYNFIAQDPFQRLTSIPNLVRTFEFPEIVDTGILLTMLTRSDPPPRRSVSTSPDSAPFRTVCDARVLAVSFEVIRRHLNVSTYILFVHHSTLLQGLHSGTTPSKVRIPWEQWGPQRSRMLSTKYNEPTWVCYMYGTRYVRLEPRGAVGTQEMSCIRMLDFNPNIVYQESVPQEGGTMHQGHGMEDPYDDEAEGWYDEMEDPQGNGVAIGNMIDFGPDVLLQPWPQEEAEEDDNIPVAEDNGKEGVPMIYEVFPASRPTRIRAGDVFKQDVVTTLPYRDVWSSEGFPYNGVMIEEECLVGLLPGESGRAEGFEFLCF